MPEQVTPTVGFIRKFQSLKPIEVFTKTGGYDVYMQRKKMVQRVKKLKE